MNERTYISRKNHLLFIGFEIFAIGLIVILYINFKVHSVEDISHYNIISIILMAFGAFTFLTGFSKRYFKLFENELVYFNKTEKYRICYKDIYLIRLFRQGRSSQVILGIVKENKEDIFEISTSFFDAKILLNLSLELYQISKKYEFLFEDEVGWIEDENKTNDKINNNNDKINNNKYGN